MQDDKMVLTAFQKVLIISNVAVFEYFQIKVYTSLT